MNHFYELGLTSMLVAIGCSHHGADADNLRSTKTPTEAPSDSEAGEVAFGGLPLVDQSEDLYRANDATELRGISAFLAESVGIDVGGRFHRLVAKETIIP